MRVIAAAARAAIGFAAARLARSLRASRTRRRSIGKTSASNAQHVRASRSGIGVAALMKRVVIAIALSAIALIGYLHDYRYRFWSAGGDTTPAELLPIAITKNHD